jgi:hypothetical protein
VVTSVIPVFLVLRDAAGIAVPALVGVLGSLLAMAGLLASLCS